MSLSQFFKGIFTSNAHDPFAGSESRSFASKQASVKPFVTPKERTFIVKNNAKGYLTETVRSQPVSLEEAINMAIALVDTAPQDFVEMYGRDRVAGMFHASVSIIDNQSGECFAYLRACDEDMSLVHCLGTSSSEYYGRKSMPFISPSYRYADIFKGAGKFGDAARTEAFCDSDSEFAVFHRWNSLYPGHVSC